jgi:glycerophosphoryl diester phosphodiesterase
MPSLIVTDRRACARRRWLLQAALAAPMAGITQPSLAQAGAPAQAPVGSNPVGSPTKAPATARRIDLQGHRGARGLLPESTLAGFEHALSLGVTTLEFDLGISADGVAVVHHDRQLNADHTRRPDGEFITAPGPLVRQLTVAELQRYDVGRARPGSRTATTFTEQQPADGQRIPTLQQVFEMCERRGASAVRFNIELKMSPLALEETVDAAAFARIAVDTARRHRVLERCCFQSFYWPSLAEVRRLAPGVPTACLSSQQSWGPGVDDGVWTSGHTRARAGSVPRMVQEAGGTIWSPFFGDVNAELVDEAQRLKLGVAVWTVNQPADIERMLDLGVDAVITDYPNRVRAVLQARGWPLPEPVRAGR